MLSNSKLVLGTVQFGLDYGINNDTGQVPLTEVTEILAYCKESGIEKIDTAAAYGNSEEVLKSSMGVEGNFKIISKLPPQVQPEEFLSEIRGSLSRLDINCLYGLLFHHFPDFQNNPEPFLPRIHQAKRLGIVRGIGYSLYHESDAEWLLSQDFDVDFIQVPFSLFDRRFEKYFPEFKAKFKTEIHVRSVFLQGLYFLTPDQLPEGLKVFKHPLSDLRVFADQISVTVGEIALTVPLLNDMIDGVVIGIDNINQLKKNLEILNHITMSCLDYPFKEIDPFFLNPANWKKQYK